MLKQTRPRLPGEAALKYEDATYTVLRKGDFVVCAVTGRRIPLEALRYWSVDRQEPYASIDAATHHIRNGEAP
jgi:hypothetical protein